MITTERDMDPHSLDILRDGVRIGFVQWHPGREPRIELWAAGYLTLKEIDAVREQYQAARAIMEAPFNPLISASPEAVGERVVRIILGEDMLTADEVSQMRRTSTPS